VENARLAPTTTGGTDKRSLFDLVGGFEVVEELAFAARHQEKRRRLVHTRQALEAILVKALFAFAGIVEAPRGCSHRS